MKTLLLILLPLFSFSQVYLPNPLDTPWTRTYIGGYENSTIKLIPIPTTIKIEGVSTVTNIETKVVAFPKSDIWVMSCFFGYGFIKGWADQIEYHHYEMSQQFPRLFRNGNTFWDGRYDDDGIWDAKHLAAGLQASLMTAAVIIKVGDYKKLPKKGRVKRILFDVVKYDFSRRLGFFLSYNVINQNKLFK